MGWLDVPQVRGGLGVRSEELGDRAVVEKRGRRLPCIIRVGEVPPVDEVLRRAVLRDAPGPNAVDLVVGLLGLCPPPELKFLRQESPAEHLVSCWRDATRTSKLNAWNVFRMRNLTSQLKQVGNVGKRFWKKKGKRKERKRFEKKMSTWAQYDTRRDEGFHSLKDLAEDARRCT